MNKNNELYFDSTEKAKRYNRIRITKLVFIYIFLTIAALATLLPFYWMINTSLKTVDEIRLAKATLFPRNITFENYTSLFTGQYSILWRYMGNTILVGFFTTILTVVTTILAAFAFARLEFRGKDLIFTILLGTMMIPGEMMIITNFTTVASVGWLNTYQALIIPFGTSVFYIFFLRQNFRQIPDELYYAAKVDGNNDFKYLWKVMLPIARPTIITVTILSMIGSWNAYIWPRTVSQEKGMKLVTDGLLNLFDGTTGGTIDHQMMAGTALVSFPLLLAFILFKKHIMRGVSRSGIKG